MHDQAHSLQLYQDLPSQNQSYGLKTPTLQDNLLLTDQMRDNLLHNNDVLLPNLEVFIVAFLLLTLPILIYLAYRHGKKMGRKEYGPSGYRYIGSGESERRSSEDSTSDNSLVQNKDTISKVSSVNSSPGLVHSSSQQPVVGTNQNSSPLSLHSKKGESLVHTEDEMIEELVLNREISAKEEGKETRLVPLKFENDATVKDIGFVTAFVERRHSRCDEKTTPLLLEEKLKLYTEDGQIINDELKCQTGLRNGSGPQEMEVSATSSPQITVSMESAGPLEVVCQSTFISQKLLSSANKVPEGKTKPTTPLAVCTDESKQHRETKSATGQSPPVLDIPHTILKQVSLNTDNRIVEERKKSESENRIEAVVEKYGVPDETGKFNKIFKDVTWIGKGSFGEVYKVVHRLDGKLYAVKKVKLKLGRFEDLKKESKVFREVFAMTDLNHSNIVRYSTCWVELEWEREKENLESVDKMDKPKRGYSEPVNNLGDISEDESYEDEASEVESESVSASDSDSDSDSESGPADYSRNSDLGFEWEASAGDRESSRKKDKKRESKRDRSPRKKKTTEKQAVPKFKRRNSQLLLKTLSRSFIEEEVEADEQSGVSSISRVESINEIPGCRLYLYIQMEYCEGQSLKDFLENSKRNVVREKALAMFRKLLEGVHTIHKSGILHRDLKPANIFLDGQENIKIGDFGLALLDKFDEPIEALTPNKVSRKGRRLHSMKVGTPMYTSPEQENGGHYDHKTDIYSLGLIFYEMLMRFETHHERYQHFGRIRNKNQLAVPFKKRFVEEGEIILKMTATFPEDRPTSEQLLVDVEELLKKLRQRSEGQNS